MRHLVQKLTALGERVAGEIWITLCVLLSLALCLDAVWWRSLPFGVAVLGPAWLILGCAFWFSGAFNVIAKGRNPIFWIIAIPFIVVSLLVWGTVWYLRHPGATFVSDSLLWAGFTYGLLLVIVAGFTIRWLKQQVGWTNLVFWGLGCLAIIPVWQWGLFAAEFFGWEMVRYYIARVGLVVVFLSGLAWTIWLVEIQARRIQSRRMEEECRDSSEYVSPDTIPDQLVVEPAILHDDPEGFRANIPSQEVSQSKMVIRVMAVLMAIWAVFPLYVMGQFIFPNFMIISGGTFAGLYPENIEQKILALYPFSMCIALCIFQADSLKNKRLDRSCWLLGISLLPFMAGLSGMAQSFNAISSNFIIGKISQDFTILLALLSLGWFGLISGGLIRYYRPESRAGYGIAAIGALCTFLCWLIPVDGVVPLIGIFKIWGVSLQYFDFTNKLIVFVVLLLICCLQIGASVFTLITLPTHLQQEQSVAGLKTFKLETGSLAVVLLALVISLLYALFKDLSFDGLLTIGTVLILGISTFAAGSFILPLVASDLVIGLIDEQHRKSVRSKPKLVSLAPKTRLFKDVFLLALVFGPLGTDRFYADRPKIGVFKFFGLGALAVIWVFLISRASITAGVDSFGGFFKYLVDVPFDAYNGDRMAQVIVAVGILFVFGWLLDLVLLALGRYLDGKGQAILVAPWRTRVLRDGGPLEAMNFSLTQGRHHIVNPFDLDAWYYGRTQQKLKQSLNATASYTIAFALVALLLMLLPGCLDIYEMPAGGGDPQLKRKKMVVQKVKKKVYVVNPFSAILFNPDIERIQLKLEELTKHLYEVGQGKGKGAGFAGGTRRGMVRFIRLKYSSGDWDQDLDLNSDLNMLIRYAAQTGHKTAKKPEVCTVRQLDAFPVGKSPPMVYLTGQRSLSLSRSEIETLREYITTKHGMIFADNGGSSGWHSQFFNLMRQVLPRTDPRTVPLDHPVHDGMPFLPIVAPHGGRTAYMWVVENRIVAYYHPGDVGDAWADGHAGVPRPVWEACYRLGVNIILYSHSEYSKWLQAQKKKD